MKILMMTVTLITLGFVHNARATTCRGQCMFTIQKVLKEVVNPNPTPSQILDFTNYCGNLWGTVSTAPTCNGSVGLRCLSNIQNPPGISLTGYGGDSYEATQKLREACLAKKPALSCSLSYVSEGFIEGEISCN